MLHLPFVSFVQSLIVVSVYRVEVSVEFMQSNDNILGFGLFTAYLLTRGLEKNVK